MKYLVLLVVLAVAIGIWRSRRVPDATPSKPPAPPLALPQNMLACAHCGIHIPQAEALMVGSNAYCCAEHRHLGPA
ncbi:MULTISPECIES: PP0621 family protein [Acidovorax]|uniref:PP0621 family protein n=1 Tax=Acidovorax TaxID=12916 RepID=UPI0002377430|nr:MULTISPECIES: PP0621 family protein [Acidovorax]KRD27405.1 hypothetical protein ASE39_03775 [Acidovorax sp. Root267]MBD9391637.1 hypothetical protein [Acidovorax sp. ACV01]